MAPFPVFFIFLELLIRFRDGASNVIHEVGPQELWDYRKKILTYRIKAKLRRDLQKLLDHILY